MLFGICLDTMKLLEELRNVARRQGLADNTIDVYSLWVRHFLTFCAQRHGQWKHPAQLATGDAEAFLNDLVIRRRLSASSQNQALNALVVLYKHVLADAIRRIIWESCFCSVRGG